MKNNPTLAEVRSLHQAGEFTSAKQGYENILKKNPKNVEALHFLAILCAQQDNFPEGIEYLQTAIRYQPDNPTLQLHLANMLKTQGLYKEAKEVLLLLLKKHPDYIPTLNNLGSVYYSLGNFTEAVHFYQLAIQKQPDYIDAYYNLGLSQIKLGKLDDAKASFQFIVKSSSKFAAAQFQLGCVFMLQNNFNDAVQAFLNISQEHPFHLETLSNLATCYLKLGTQDEAKNYYLKALELAPDDTQILFNLGVIFTQQGHTDSAIQYYQRAVHINADFFDAHNNLGVAFLAKQHVGFALHHFQEALRLQPNNIAIQHTVKMLAKDKRLFSSPPEYIKNLFDFYADHYEPHLLKALDYQVPEFLFRAGMECIKPAPASLDVLDLGCGTGLCGIPWKPFAKTLTGVDLSERMLEIAAKKNIYDSLVTASLEEFLKDKQITYDILIAGDALVYLGDLENLFSLAQQALRPQGLFIFNTEISEHENFVMNQSGRFAHQKNYLEQLAEKNHFVMVFYKAVVTRMQNNEPVYGHICVCRSDAT